ncbi:MAG TPA: FtsX-like permease family protein [Steroidobacteraceae bacterium]|nr:FtsX-like permease family protein [Steroidobacteraceae bacterium]
MEIVPILSALRRNKVGAILVALQIALTLAVVANGMSIIQGHLAAMGRPSGIDEADIFTLQNHWVGEPEDLHESIEADLAALRNTPGVQDAEATNSYPLRGGGWGWGIRLKPDQTNGGATSTTLYFNDTHGLDAMGLKLVAGRWFSASEIQVMRVDDQKATPSAVLTAALAKKLFPKGDAVGQVIYMVTNAPVRVIGVVERAQTPWPAQGFGDEFAEYSTFLPLQFVANQMSYLVRARPGQLAAVMHAAPDRLYAVTRQRVIDQLMPFSETRTRAYQIQKSESWLLGTVCGLLLAITGFGTVGLTMYWVAQRRRQIGLRRALGARRIDILRYFHTENLLVAGTGAVLGVLGGLGANLWMATHMGTHRMSWVYIGIGALIVLVLCQLAVLWPAYRAASTPPSLATRGL